MSREIPLLASEKLSLFKLIIFGVILVVVIIGGLITWIVTSVNKDEEAYNEKISEVCAFYKVEIIEYDSHNNLYKLAVDPETWNSNNDEARRRFCRNCKDAFLKMMHKYGIISEDEDVNLMVYKNNKLVASVINNIIDTSHDIGEVVSNAIEEANKEIMDIFNSISSAYN